LRKIVDETFIRIPELWNIKPIDPLCTYKGILSKGAFREV